MQFREGQIDVLYISSAQNGSPCSIFSCHLKFRFKGRKPSISDSESLNIQGYEKFLALRSDPLLERFPVTIAAVLQDDMPIIVGRLGFKKPAQYTKNGHYQKNQLRSDQNPTSADRHRVRNRNRCKGQNPERRASRSYRNFEIRIRFQWIGRHERLPAKELPSSCLVRNSHLTSCSHRHNALALEHVNA